jgi:hypothetical protein
MRNASHSRRASWLADQLLTIEKDQSLASTIMLDCTREMAMPHYRVSFFKNGRSCDGRPIGQLQRTIDIRHARSLERAVQAAQREYEHFHHVPYWWQQADYFELEVNGRKVDYHPSPLQG